MGSVVAPRVVLKPGREKPVRGGHPWVFSGAIARIDGQPADGDTIAVTDSQGQFLARGLLNRHSQIVVRLFTQDPATDLTADLLHARIAAANARRTGFLRPDATAAAAPSGLHPDATAAAGPSGLHPDAAAPADHTSILPPDTDAYRVVFSEADGLPGLIIDRYGPYVVLQCSTLGLQRRKAAIVAAIQAVLDPAAIIERPDVEALTREGLSAHAAGMLPGTERSVQAGVLAGSAPPQCTISEYGLTFQVDLLGGQKTGFFLDQRENRRRVASYCAGLRVLNCFAYTGAFAVYAAAAGATQIINVDTSAEALHLARAHLAQNDLASERDEYLVGDVFQVLRDYRERGEQFDLIILDPPKFAHNTASVPRATRGYKDINLQALHLLRPNGLLATFSCSGLVSADLFQKVVYGASVDAARPAQILERFTQGPDHPVLLSFPESEYLKGLLCRVV